MTEDDLEILELLEAKLSDTHARMVANEDALLGVLKVMNFAEDGELLADLMDQLADMRVARGDEIIAEHLRNKGRAMRLKRDKLPEID